MDKIGKEALRKREMAKLGKLFKNLPKDRQRMAEGLRREAAFMYATLAELQDIIGTTGTVDLFEQGQQQMLREHPAVKTYNSMIKNYVSVCKHLFDLLPDDKGKGATDELMDFVKKSRP